MRLYRAADDADVRPGYSFAARREHAEAYLDNPGFGGRRLWRTSIKPKRVLDLCVSVDEWHDLSDVLGRDIAPSRYQYHFARVITADAAVIDSLAALGYDWACFRDDYPEGCTTWVPLTEDAADSAADAMREVRCT